jgi:uncharacterized repeat protein (TIGR03803 family)
MIAHRVKALLVGFPLISFVYMTPSRAATESVLYSFEGRKTYLQYPSGGLIYVGGALYGNAHDGVFRVTLSGHATFLGRVVGPATGSLTTMDRIFFGAVSSANSGYPGYIFSITNTGVAKVIYTFKSDGDGRNPYAGLTKLDGLFYGTTVVGGAFGYGSVFSITPSGEEHVIYSFKGGNDGAQPADSLINVGGTFYGTTSTGGPKEAGTVFSVTPAGIEKVIYSFTSGCVDGDGDGASPFGSLLKLGDRFYGTTNSGGSFGYGTVFSVTTTGNEKILHSFQKIDGANPSSGLVDVGGVLYGTTDSGGSSSNGTVFSITVAGVLTTLHAFGPSGDGIAPRSGLINVNGTLFGTTQYGGANGLGTVYSVTP